MQGKPLCEIEHERELAYQEQQAKKLKKVHVQVPKGVSVQVNRDDDFEESQQGGRSLLTEG